MSPLLPGLVKELSWLALYFLWIERFFYPSVINFHFSSHIHSPHRQLHSYCETLIKFYRLQKMQYYFAPSISESLFAVHTLLYNVLIWRVYIIFAFFILPTTWAEHLATKQTDRQTDRQTVFTSRPARHPLYNISQS